MSDLVNEELSAQLTVDRAEGASIVIRSPGGAVITVAIMERDEEDPDDRDSLDVFVMENDEPNIRVYASEYSDPVVRRDGLWLLP